MSVPAERDVDAVRHLEAAHLDSVLRAASHQVDRHDAVGEDPPRPVDVGEEEVQRLQPLAQPALHHFPVGCVEQPRQEVDRNDPLLRPLLPVHREGDPLVQEGALGERLHGGNLVRLHPVERATEFPAVGARHAGGLEHLVVVGRVHLVVGEETPPGRRAAAVGCRLPPGRIAIHEATLVVRRTIARLWFGMA